MSNVDDLVAKHQEAQTKAVQDIVAWAVVLAALRAFLLPPLILATWNLGLESAGIVPHGIDWTTALGLAAGVYVTRIAVGAGKR